MTGEPDILVWVADPGTLVDKVVQTALESQKMRGVNVVQYPHHAELIDKLNTLPPNEKPDAVLVSSFASPVVDAIMSNWKHTGIAVSYYSWENMKPQAEKELVHYIHKDDHAGLAAFLTGVRKMKEYSQRADKALLQ